MDAEKLADGLFAQTRRYVDSAIAKAVAGLPPPAIDLDDIAQRAAVRIPKPRDGKDGADGANGANGIDGKSITAADVEPLLAGLVERSVRAMPAARDGKDGRDGVSVSLEAVQTLVAAEVARAVAALPRPADGKDGERGPPGKDGDTPIIDLHEVAEIIKADREMIEMLRGERGEKGDRGDRGEQGIAGQRGADGSNGQDGASVTPEQVRDLMRQRFAEWALEFEREAEKRQRDAMGLVPLPRDGTPGRDGRDGVGLDDFEFEAELVDDRALHLTLSAGGREKRCVLRLPVIVDRETWRAEQQYERGDAVTFGGQIYIARADTKARPGDSGDWRLAVRRGKDADK